MVDFPKPYISYHTCSQKDDSALFSILIPTWNNLDFLKICISSILKNSHFKHQIIIHVNEGTDGTLAWVKEQGFDYSYSKNNAGVCYAMNAMATLCYTDYLLYMNDDMYACKDWDKNLWEQKIALGHDHFYISATLIEPAFTSSSAVIAPHDFGTTPQSFNEAGLTTFVSKLKHTNWYGSSWPPSLVSISMFKKVGGYSEEFSPGFGSDPDFAMKLWQAGVRDFIGVGSSFAYHFLSKSTERVKRNDGRKQFAKKWKIPSSFFYKNVLKMGTPIHQAKALTFSKNFAYFIARLRALYISLK
ncbi:MAG: glycosyltransferase [Bacteroidetes bacterium]|nr:MAG: glycosyltransferase [Bacteroidota bacterium]